MLKFPDGFVWGAATSAYQIEGSWDSQGKAPGIWDIFCQQPGKISDGSSGQVACDHVNQFKQDVALMGEIGLQAYRFSVSWPRVVPGPGAVNSDGLGFYDRLVDELLASGIQPYCTLFHWDAPQWFAEEGGWLSPASVGWFEEYARRVVARLGDRVKDWITFNEPGIFVNLGHSCGDHAPGLKLPNSDVLQIYRNVFLSHGASVRVCRELSPNCRVSYAPHCVTAHPDSDSPDDIAAAEEYTFGGSHPERHFWQQRLYLDAVLHGEWPADICRDLAPDWTCPTAAETSRMAEPLDYLCLNYYSGERVKAGERGPEIMPQPIGAKRTAFGWSVTPEGLRWCLNFHANRYGLPLVVSENGMSCHDWIGMDGKVADSQRQDFLHRYLVEAHKAIEDGADLRAYFAWSLLDNFEWAEGFKQRFGLIHVDFETQVRTVKESAKAYGGWIAQNALPS